jgi:hypothetical protein
LTREHHFFGTKRIFHACLIITICNKLKGKEEERRGRSGKEGRGRSRRIGEGTYTPQKKQKQRRLEIETTRRYALYGFARSVTYFCIPRVSGLNEFLREGEGGGPREGEGRVMEREGEGRKRAKKTSRRKLTMIDQIREATRIPETPKIIGSLKCV